MIAPDPRMGWKPPFRETKFQPFPSTFRDTAVSPYIKEIQEGCGARSNMPEVKNTCPALPDPKSTSKACLGSYNEEISSQGCILHRSLWLPLASLSCHVPDSLAR